MLKNWNLKGIGLCILNDALLDEKSDGMVLYSYQSKIESEVSKLGLLKLFVRHITS